jgi:hypothetical protein
MSGVKEWKVVATDRMGDRPDIQLERILNELEAADWQVYQVKAFEDFEDFSFTVVAWKLAERKK